VSRAHNDASAWERVGRLRLQLNEVQGAIDALDQARKLGPSAEGLLDLALAYQVAGDVGAEVSASEQATLVAPHDPVAWSRYAHALARTDRVGECIEACEHALALGADPEVSDLLESVRARVPRGLEAA
jgi:tetratricopeptide (TPR) repeat protein